MSTCHSYAEMAEGPLEGARAETSLDLLQAVYRDRYQPLSVRMRAAALCLPFEFPKLSVNVTSPAAGFGGCIEKLAQSRGIATVIDATPPFRKGEGEASAPEVFEPSGR
jgi:hypothetical protein